MTKPQTPARYGPGRAIHPEVRKEREKYIGEALQRQETWAQIAAHFAVDVETVRRWWNKTHFSTKYENVFDKERRCLSCGEMFWSEGPHNRRCMRCKSHRPADTPYEPGGYGSPGRQKEPRR
jgi:uncharacterized paraquat-inducible protein A